MSTPQSSPSTPITLRPYQENFISLMRKAFQKHKHVLGIAAQGSGKTVCFSYMAQSSISKGHKVLILSNRAKLLRQSGGSLAKFGIEAEYISAQHRKVPEGNCIVAMAQTLRKRYMLPEYQKFLRSIDLLIIDEIHQQDFNFLLESGIFNDKWVLGVTATAKRCGGQRQLGLDFEVMIEGLDVQTGIDLGFLVPAKHYTLDAPDLSNVGIESLTGDYKAADLYQVFSNTSVFGGVVREFKRLGNMEKTICFCCNQIHAIETCIAFNEAGISSKFVISGLRKDDENYHLLENNLHLTGEKEVIEDEFERGDFIVLCNVAIYTTGFDCVGIRNVILNRATLSEPLFDQMIGRASRIDPVNYKKFFRILDFGENVSRHGLFERKKQYSLWHDYKGGGGVASTKECPPLKEDKSGRVGCGRLIHISYPECPFCGYVFKTPEEMKELELIEIIGGKFEFKTMTPLELKAYAELHGYKMQWVYRQLWVANNEKDFKRGMKELGCSMKFIYFTLSRLKNVKLVAESE